MTHTARISARIATGLLVVIASVVGFASNAYAMVPPNPTPGTDPTATTTVVTVGSSVADRVQWIATGAVGALVIVAVGLALAALLSRREHTHVHQLQA